MIIKVLKYYILGKKHSIFEFFNKKININILSLFILRYFVNLNLITACVSYVSQCNNC